jgi:hypothetical protein
MGRPAMAAATVVEVDADTTPTSSTASSHRAAAGMVGVLVAETWPIGSPHPVGCGSPIVAAMFDLARAITQPTPPCAGGEVTDAHGSVAEPAWLLPVAFAHPKTTDLVQHTVALAGRADIPSDETHACVTYVKLAAQLVDYHLVPEAIDKVTDRAVPSEQPLETGRHAADGLAVGLWALTQPTGFDELLPRLTATASRPVVAAASGLVALRDGLAAIPPAWYRHLHLTHECLALAQSLHKARRQAGRC